VQQILQRAPVIQAALNLRHKLFRHVDGNATPIRATVENITLMLLARQTCRAILADAPATPQAQRTEKRRPKIADALRSQCATSEGDSESTCFMQACDTIHMYNIKQNRTEKAQETRYLQRFNAFRDRN
jgi:hypothetical protein